MVGWVMGICWFMVEWPGDECVITRHPSTFFTMQALAGCLHPLEPNVRHCPKLSAKLTQVIVTISFNPFAPELEIDGGKIILVVILSLKGPNSILSESRCPSYVPSLLIKMLLIGNIGL